MQNGHHPHPNHQEDAYKVDNAANTPIPATPVNAKNANGTPPPSKRRKLDRPPSPPWKSAAHDGPTSFVVDGKRRSSRRNPSLPQQLSQAERTNATTPAPSSSRSRPLPRIKLKVNKPSLGAYHPDNILRPRQFPSFRAWFEHEHPKVSSDETSAAHEAHIRRRLLSANSETHPLHPSRCSLYVTDPIDEPARPFSHTDHLLAHAVHFKKLLDKERRHHRALARLLAQACAEEWRKRQRRPEDAKKSEGEALRARQKGVVRDLSRLWENVRAEVEAGRIARWEEERKARDQEALSKAIRQSTMLFERRREEKIRVGKGTETVESQPVSDSESQSEGESGSENGSESSSTEKSDFISESESNSDGNLDQDVDEDEALTAEQLRKKYAHLNGVAESKDDDDDDRPPPSIPEWPFQLQSRTSSRSPSPSVQLPSTPPSRPEQPLGKPTMKLDEVDSVLLDDSEESTDMSDEDDEDEGDDDDEEEEEEDTEVEEEEEGGGLGMLGFFSAPELEEMKRKAKEEEEQVEKGEEDDREEKREDGVMHDEQDREIEMEKEQRLEAEDEESAPVCTKAQSHAVHDTHTAMGQEHKQKESLPSFVPPSKQIGQQENPPADKEDKPASEDDGDLDIKTPIPHLLRGTLRKYQHYGLDWLAGLYNNNINGILADEMGLGKTIQTIALLAHLAVEHEVWGPHLVVVPTSVMLNWEMEFKKWAPGFKILTYYGSQEERRQKRRGWMDDDRWHVCITSYQLVLQDQQTFKRRNWHYMILDEAHNIKNFRSQRWQTLLTFKTHSRLLLTGTPLQNNLTELWSLLFFLMPSDDEDMGIEGFADLRNFSEWFRRPVEQILEHGRETMDDEAKQVVSKLHTVLRPYILRRLKIDVEKQMPAKYEHVVLCRLSKRQRYLYDGFMSRAQTRETLASGNYLSIINCLMQLRKVCNHPDLFETRPITTSFAMPRSAVAEFEINELLVRRRLLKEQPGSRLDLDFLNLAPISDEHISKLLARDTHKIAAAADTALAELARKQREERTIWDMQFNGSTVESALSGMENAVRKARAEELKSCLYLQAQRHGRQTLYGRGLYDLVSIDTSRLFQRPPLERSRWLDWYSNRSELFTSPPMILSLEQRARTMQPLIEKYAFVTPAVVAPGITEATLTPISTRMLSPAHRFPYYDPLHESQMRLSIAFPDKRLLQYDCGKLQQLEKLLRKLAAGGHRALIFTQMTKMLDILEQFLNIHGHRYLRLDGATKVEQRQVLTDRFNNDPRILAFILSSRSGGLGINLTGADTVIFYDLDWNPAMDKQCQDRCHRIGQTRDVHIYRFVSEYTIESNILRKANQKRMLDDVVIQEGEFTTEYAQRLDVRNVLGDYEGHDEASAAMDRVLDTKVGGAAGAAGASIAQGTSSTSLARTFEQAEDKEDIDAAKNAEKELEHADAGDFDEVGSTTAAVGAGGIANAAGPSSSMRSTPAPTLGSSVAGTVTATATATANATAVGTREGTPATAPYPVPGQGETGSDANDAAAVATIADEFGHVDDYLLRFMEWAVKDEPLVLPPDKRKKSRRGRDEHRIRRHRR